MMVTTIGLDQTHIISVIDVITVITSLFLELYELMLETTSI